MYELEAKSGPPIRVYSTARRLLAVSTLRPGVTIVSPQYLLLYFLLAYHRATGADKSVMLAFYHWTIEIVNAGVRALKTAADAKLALSSPFALTTKTMGIFNQNSAYLIRMAGAIQMVGDSPPAALGFGRDISAILKGLPVNYNPSRGGNRPRFDYDACAPFRRAGLKVFPKSPRSEIEHV